LPQLLKALPDSDSYFRICLVNLLSEIPDPQRDAAFVTLLEKILKEGDPDSFAVPAVEPAMRVLAARNVAAAVPVLRAYIDSEGIEIELRAEARIALGRMGALDPGSIPNVPYEIESGLSTEGMDVQVAILALLLKYELVKAPLKLVEFEEGGGPTKVLKGTIEGGTWYLRVGQEQGGRVPFYYNWHTGPLSAAGYTGVAKVRNGQWIVTDWRMMWIS
jgi:HEAT repeat protein